MTVNELFQLCFKHKSEEEMDRWYEDAFMQYINAECQTSVCTHTPAQDLIRVLQQVREDMQMIIDNLENGD